ncbi:toll/interleukin-1 receptor domain-containing protein [Moraxella nasovis]|uniref:toll/interleukin-1 receptor domain-containing protein n=1 Tax=Moraxella nasovis TaxID=2904121 RepID=UPI001F610237|nr:toll/interleukin-1 receptor domain-containing protein [Moraxella nasovis]UNU73065.1 toll/interleukin-1 receptor domain-containing protein [Moraxella nasovis]
MSNIFYCFECDYANRTKEKPFLKDILNNFTKDEIVGFNLYINNNPYNKQFHLGIFFDNDQVRDRFDIWLKQNHPDRIIKSNMKFLDLVFHANVCGICDENGIDLAITSHSNHMFIFPEKDFLENHHPQFAFVNRNQPRIFLSHSSLDKESVVEPMFRYLQSREIHVWLDKYEIDYGDNIYFKINEGIKNSEFAIFVITENFLNSKWANEELSSFVNLIFNDKCLVILNISDKSNIPPMIMARKFMEWNNGDCLLEIANVLKRKLNL